MKEPLPAKGKVAPVPREAPARPARAIAETEVRVVAHHYRRMKPQRVYPLVVELQGLSSGLAAPVFIHPFIPGAHVTPTEQALDPADPDARATFYVTPLARGTLRNARLDVFCQGRLIQEMPLHLRAVTQRLTWVLAALTVLIPSFLLYYTVYHPLQGYKFVERPVPPAAAEDGNAGKAAPEKASKKKGNAAKGKDAGTTEKLEKAPKKDGDGDPGKDADEAELDEALAADAEQEPGGDPKEEPQKKKSSRPDGPPPVVEAATRTIQMPADPGEVLEERILKNVPTTFTPPWSEEPLEVPLVRPVAEGLGTTYTYLCSMKTDYASFWVGVVLLGLTVASAIVHRPARARKRSKPLVLAAAKP